MGSLVDIHTGASADNYVRELNMMIPLGWTLAKWI